MHENPIPSHHRVGGYIRTTRAPYVDEIAPEFISSAVQHGLKFTDDFNGPAGREGVGYYDFNIKGKFSGMCEKYIMQFVIRTGGMRDSAAREFLGPLMNQNPIDPNFNLELKAIVNKIILSPITFPTSPSSNPTSSNYVMPRNAPSFHEMNSNEKMQTKNLVKPGKMSNNEHKIDNSKNQITNIREVLQSMFNVFQFKLSTSHTNNTEVASEEIIEEMSHQAIGVEYIQNNKVKYAYISRGSTANPFYSSYSFPFGSAKSGLALCSIHY